MQEEKLQLLEATISDIHRAYLTGEITCRRLTESYLARIEAYDRSGPSINSIITVSPTALADADALDLQLASEGLTRPLHGIPVIIKDQVDTVGMPTTLGSVLFENYFPDQDATVTTKLKEAGALILAKATLGELGGGDTHGTLFGSTRNPYDLERTVGGSSGGSGASVAANLSTIAVGQEGLASIRRPAAWNSIVGMRPTAGLVSRTGAFGGWPGRAGSLGPMARTVEDAARLLDVMVGYDPEDPLTAYGVGHIPMTYTDSLVSNGLQGARVGILRASFGLGSEPDSEDFENVSGVFDKAVFELESAGATIVDPVVIPSLNELLGLRAGSGAAESFARWMARSENPPFRTQDELFAHPKHAEIISRKGGGQPSTFKTTTHYEYLVARDQLMANMLKTMADHDVDVIVHKTVEHTATLISEGIAPPYVNHKGVPHLNTFLVDVPSVSVPAGFTSQKLPVGITFLGRPFSDALMLKLAYGYEQATMHRQPPATTPSLPGEL